MNYFNYNPYDYESDYDDYSDDSDDDDSEYEEYISDAYEFIKGIEQVNIKQFPEIVNQKVGKRTVNKQELLDEMKLLLYSMLETRLSILLTFGSEFIKELGVDEQSYNQIHSMVDNRLKQLGRVDPSTFIVTLTDLERAVIGDPVLENFLENHPKVAYEIVKRFSK